MKNKYLCLANYRVKGYREWLLDEYDDTQIRLTYGVIGVDPMSHWHIMWFTSFGDERYLDINRDVARVILAGLHYIRNKNENHKENDKRG